MLTAEELASRQKIKSVKDQMERVRAAGEMCTITCPYCGQLNVEGSNLCCDTLRTCVITIAMGWRQGDIERAEAILGN